MHEKEDLTCEVVVFHEQNHIREHYSPPPSRKNCSIIYFWHIEQKMSTNLEILKKKK